MKLGISFTDGGTIAAGTAITYSGTVAIQPIDKMYGAVPVLHYLGVGAGAGYVSAGAGGSSTFDSEDIWP